MYKDALVNLMIGNLYKPANERAFWSSLIPFDIETQLWMRLKVAGYEIKEDRPSDYIEIQRLPNYESFDLVKLYELVQTELKPEISRQYDEYEGTLIYTKVMMLIGQYSQALEQLTGFEDSCIQATFLGLILNESGILRTRNNFLNFVQDNKAALVKDFRLEDLSKHLSSSFDYLRSLYFIGYQIQLS